MQIGDCVILKSGGPLMTVTAVGAEITVTWFPMNSRETESEAFPPDALQIIPDGDPKPWPV